MKYVNDNFAQKTELTRAIDQVKSEIPEPVDLSNYETKTTAERKYALKTEIPEPVDLTKYVAKNDDGSLSVYSTESNIASFFSSIDSNTLTLFRFGYNDTYNTVFMYRSSKTADTGEVFIYVDGHRFQSFSMFGTARNTTIDSNLYVSGKITSNGSNTITHYCPIEAGQNISDFVAGKPVFMSGHVYKYVNGSFISSTANDSTDCICSVVINGSYKEFVGVITEVDAENGCIKFASHGDMLFTVDDANLYQIGDVILYNGKILDEDYAMTLRIQQSIVGKVTAKINETTLAIFKS